MTMPSLGRGILATGTYVALIAAASVYVFQIAAPPADMQATLAALFPFQLLAVVLSMWLVVRGSGWRKAGFGQLDWTATIWLLPSFAVLAVMGWDIAHALNREALVVLGTTGLLLFVVTPFMIAFSEEVVFRGILLRGAMASLPVMYAMLLSAALFGMFHWVNGIAGQGLSGTTNQVVFALLVGFFLAPIALRIGNLWPLIIWHWLWNVAVFFSQLVDLFHPFVIVGIAMQAVISIWLWADMIRHPRPA